MHSRLILLLGLLLHLCTLAPVRAQDPLPFGSAFLPTLTFTESYTDTVVLGDFGYEQRPSLTLTMTARVSMKDVVVADLLADGNVLSLALGNLAVDLGVLDAVASTSGTNQVLTWDIPIIDANTGELVSAGTVTLSYNATEMIIKISTTNPPDGYSIYARAEAGQEDTLDSYPLSARFTLGPYGLADTTLYVSGTATTFETTVGTGDAAQTFYNLARVRLTGEIDATLPTVSITFPVRQATVTGRPITVLGKCADKHGIASVELKVNDGEYVPAAVVNGNWSVGGVVLNPGNNALRVRCTDADGHITNIAQNNLFSLKSNLTVQAAGDAGGKIVASFFEPLVYAPPAASPKRITLHKDGESMVLTAVPDTGAVFDGWTAVGTITPEQAASPKLKIKHQPNLVLTARFIVNPFDPVDGQYNGFAATADADRSKAGYFSGRVTSSGSFTGVINLPLLDLRLRGQFSNTGRLKTTVKVKKVAYEVELVLNVSGTGQEQITGTVKGGDVDVTITAGRSALDQNGSPGAEPATYNVIIPPAPNQAATYPVGIGFGKVTVSPSGSVRFTGRLASGPAFNAAAQITAGGMWPFYASLYGKKGAIFGPVTFNAASTTSDLSGTLNWYKPAGVKNVPVYLAGFSGQSTISGAKFVPPAPGQRLFLDGSADPATFQIDAPADGALPALSLGYGVTLGTDNKMTFSIDPTDAIQGITVKFIPATGFFGGTMKEGRATLSFQGIVVPAKLNQAAGLFRRGGSTGAVTISKPTP